MTRIRALVALAIVLPFILGAGCLQGQTPDGMNTTSVARHALM